MFGYPPISIYFRSRMGGFCSYMWMFSFIEIFISNVILVSIMKLQAKHIPDDLIWEFLTRMYILDKFHCIGWFLHDAGFPMKVIHAKLQRWDKRGWIEWGVSIRCCWLTSEGIDKAQELGYTR